MNKLFSPVINMLNKFQYPQKFVIISSIFIILIALMMFELTTQMNTAIDFARQERAGVEYINALADFLQDIQQNKGNNNLSKIDEDILRINDLNQKFGNTLKIGNKWDSVENKWLDLKNNMASSYQQIELADNIFSLILYISDTSNLTLDPDIDTYYMMDITVWKIPQIIKNTKLLRSVGTRALAKKNINFEEKVRLINLIGQINTDINFIAANTKKVYEANEDVQPELNKYVLNNNRETGLLVKTINNIINANNINIEASDFYNMASKSLDSNYTIYHKGSAILDQLLQKRISKFSDKKYTVIIISIVLLIIAAYLFIAFYLSTIHTIDSLMETMHIMSDGNLAVEAEVKTKDELSNIALSLNTMSGKFRNLISEVTKTIEEVSACSEQMAAAADQTAHGSQQVAMSAEQLAGGSQQIATGVTQLAISSQEQSRLVKNTLNNIHSINQAVQNIAQEAENTIQVSKFSENNAHEGQIQAELAVEKINQIKISSTDISNTINELGDLSENIELIVDLIKGISGKTNLLALNASIEAARAGAQGKGFAVVADEVKKLASQSADATDKITAMIKEIQNKTNIAVTSMNANTRNVENGVIIIKDVGKSLEQIINAAKETTAYIQDISKEVGILAKSSDNVVRMAKNISDLTQKAADKTEEISSITEESAASSEEIATVTEEQTASIEEINANSQELAKIAENLQAQVTVFKI